MPAADPTRDAATGDPHGLALLRGFAGIATSTISDVLDELRIGGAILGMRALLPGRSAAGYAATVQETNGPRGSFTVADFRLGPVIDALQPGQLLVIANGGAPVSTWGGIASFAAARRGAAGLVVDGGVRDLPEIVAAGLPAFVRHTVPCSGKTRVRIEALDVPVTIAGVTVAPGDVIVADETGVVCVPAARATEVQARATGFSAQDDQARAAIAAGMSFSEALHRFSKM